MIRITIDWKFISPLLQVVSGIVTVEEIDTLYVEHPYIIFKCKIKLESGCTGYQSIDENGINTELFEKYKPAIDLMAKGYFNGIVLKDQMFHWLEEKE